MEEGKEFMRSFGDLLQYHQKKKEHDSAGETPLVPQPDSAANGIPAARQGDKETGRQGDG
jgi:hypothetical protein